MKHFIAIAVVLAVVVFGFFLFAPEHIAEEQGIQPSGPIYDENTVQLETLENDVDAVEALKRCEANKLPIGDCIATLRGNNIEVTGLAPDTVGEDGFAGLLIFPLQDGDTVIMDYNTGDPSKQFLYFGTYESLRDLVEEGALDRRSQENFSSLRHIIRE